MSAGDSLLARVRQARDDEAALDLLEEFQSGFPIVRLRELLACNSETGVRAGVWIASELGVRARPLLKDIERLLAHPDRYVRFFALDCVLDAAEEQDGSVLAFAAALIRDSDSAVRWKAMTFLAAASVAQLSAANREAGDPELKDRLSWLLGAEKLGGSAILAKLAAADAEERIVGAIAAARIADRDPSVLHEARELSHEGIRVFAADWLARFDK